MVAEGTYLDAINFNGKAITVRRTDPMAPVVVAAITIDGTGNFHVVQCVNGEGQDTVLDGFTITGGLGMRNSNNSNNSSPTVIDCTFSGNTSNNGGGMRNNPGGSPTVIDCTLSGNSADFGGGGMYNFSSSSPTVTNCIIWGNGPALDQITEVDSVSTVAFSDVEGGFTRLGNIDADPLFVDPASGDFRLAAGSPGIDAGNNWAIAGLADTDLDGNPRFADDPATTDTGCGVPVVVDMGAYEFQGDPFPVKLGDIDAYGTVGIVDFLALLADWGPCEPGCCLADLDIDGDVGIIDFLLLLENWG